MAVIGISIGAVFQLSLMVARPVGKAPSASTPRFSFSACSAAAGLWLASAMAAPPFQLAARAGGGEVFSISRHSDSR